MSANGNSTRATSASASVSGPELVIKRVFDAPRSLVFQAWTETEHLKRWEGAPVGFTVTTAESDIRPGGAFRICMRSPEGVDNWLQGMYTEVVPPERLAFTHTWLRRDGTPGVETLVTITFAELGTKTELTLHQTGFDTIASRDGHNGGWNSTFDRLAEYLTNLHLETRQA